MEIPILWKNSVLTQNILNIYQTNFRYFELLFYKVKNQLKYKYLKPNDIFLRF